MLGAMEGASLITGLMKGVLGKVASNQFIRETSHLQASVPSAVTQAGAIMGQQANMGLSSVDLIKGNMMSANATNFGKAKKVATTPTQLMAALMSSNEASLQGERDVDVQDAMMRNQNQQRYASWLSTIKAPAEQRVEDFDINKALGIARERMQGTANLMGGIEGGVGSAISAAGLNKQVGYLDDQNALLQSFLGV